MEMGFPEFQKYGDTPDPWLFFLLPDEAMTLLT